MTTNKDMDLERERFRKKYIGAVLDEFDEDFFLFRSLKRTINSYMKTPDKAKIHSIINKIVILRRVFKNRFLYEELIKIVQEDIYKSCFIKYILNEVFSTNHEIEEFDECWEENILELYDEKKIFKQTKAEAHMESKVYLYHIKNQSVVR